MLIHHNTVDLSNFYAFIIFLPLDYKVTEGRICDFSSLNSPLFSEQKLVPRCCLALKSLENEASGVCGSMVPEVYKMLVG